MKTREVSPMLLFKQFICLFGHFRVWTLHTPGFVTLSLIPYKHDHFIRLVLLTEDIGVEREDGENNGF